MSFVLTVICLNLVPLLTMKRLFQTRYSARFPILHFTKFTLKGESNRSFYRVKGSNSLHLTVVIIFLLSFSISRFLTVGCPIFCVFQFCFHTLLYSTVRQAGCYFPNCCRITPLLYHIFITERTSSVSTECRAQICIMAAIP